MKNYKEMAERVFQRSDFIIEKKLKRRSIMRTITSIVSCFVFFILIGSVVLIGISNHKSHIPSYDVTNTVPHHPDQEQSNGAAVLLPNNLGIVWADDAMIEDLAFIEWHGKTIGSSLYEAFIKKEEDCVFAIRAQVNGYDGQYLYKGITLAEYNAAAEEEKQLPDKLGQLLKEGEALKYGEALYKIGTAEGLKWNQESYEDRIAYYGSKLLSKYIVDGVFLRERLEADLASPISDAAQMAYKEAYTAYMDEIYKTAQKQLTEQNIFNERKSIKNEYKTNNDLDYLVIYASEDEFSVLNFENISSFVFTFASKTHCEETLPFFPSDDMLG